MTRYFASRAIALVFVVNLTGCSIVGDTLGISAPAYPSLPATTQIRNSTAPASAGGRELTKELFATHRVEPGDTLLVQPVDFDSPVRLPPDQPVQPDGSIDLGKYGRPVVAGKTLAEIEAQIKPMIIAQEKDAKDPIQITVRLIGRPMAVFYVIGEVNAPGSFPITGRETVLDALVAAGGLSKRADRDGIVLSRPTLPEGCRQVFPVCYLAIVQLGDTTTNYQLKPGDRVFVPSKNSIDDLLPARFRKKKPCTVCDGPQVGCSMTGIGGCAPVGVPIVSVPDYPPSR